MMGLSIFSKKQKIAISGSGGFIGSHLAKALQEMGNEIYVIESRILQRPDLLTHFFTETNPDYIYHLASYGNHSQQTNMGETIKANVIGTFNMLECSKNIRYKGFVNFGSSSEYGKKLKPMKESDSCEPTGIYALTKQTGTLLAELFSKTFDKPVVTVRPFSVYGDGEANFRFIPTIIDTLRFSRTLTLDPFAYHDWIYIDDFIDGVLTVQGNIKKLKGEIVNIGTGKQYANADVVQELLKIAGKNKLDVTTVGKMRENDSSMWVADNKKLKSLGWKPQHTLRQGLKKTYKYYTKNDK